MQLHRRDDEGEGKVRIAAASLPKYQARCGGGGGTSPHSLLRTQACQREGFLEQLALLPNINGSATEHEY